MAGKIVTDNIGKMYVISKFIFNIIPMEQTSSLETVALVSHKFYHIDLRSLRVLYRDDR